MMRDSIHISLKPIFIILIIANVINNARSWVNTTCLHQSGLPWTNWKPYGESDPRTFKTMATTSDSSVPTGFQSRCSWVIINRYTYMGWGNISADPDTIFVRMDFILFFYEKILPCLSNRFILLLGDHDHTFPRQLDDRFPQDLNRSTFLSLIHDPRIFHIFSEHLDERHDIITPIPLGINPGEFTSDPLIPGLKGQRNGDFLYPHWLRNISFDMKTHKDKVLRIDRQRHNGDSKITTWLDRHIVAGLCSSEWNAFCVHGSAGKPLDFQNLLSQYSFVLCVHGGGIDPNPKVWQTLVAGSIPIIANFAGDTMYSDFPIAFIGSEKWSNESVTQAKLDKWLVELRSYYEDPVKREIVLEKLTSAYWWKKVEEKIKLLQPLKIISPTSRISNKLRRLRYHQD